MKATLCCSSNSILQPPRTHEPTESKPTLQLAATSARVKAGSIFACGLRVAAAAAARQLSGGGSRSNIAASSTRQACSGACMWHIDYPAPWAVLAALASSFSGEGLCGAAATLVRLCDRPGRLNAGAQARRRSAPGPLLPPPPPSVPPPFSGCERCGDPTLPCLLHPSSRRGKALINSPAEYGCQIPRAAPLQPCKLTAGAQQAGVALLCSRSVRQAWLDIPKQRLSGWSLPAAVGRQLGRHNSRRDQAACLAGTSSNNILSSGEGGSNDCLPQGLPGPAPAVQVCG